MIYKYGRDNVIAHPTKLNLISTLRTSLQIFNSIDIAADLTFEMNLIFETTHACM